MKQINILCAILTIIIGLSTLNYARPFISKGTAVIYSMTSSYKKGNQPNTIVTDDLSTKQHEVLNFAYVIAKLDGFKSPTALQGILMQESHACTLKNFRVSGLTNKPGDRYFGCGQIKLAAAHAVLNAFPEMWKYLETKTDEEIQARLILDDEFNIRISSKYILLMGINQNHDLAITAYNTGLGGAKGIDPSTFNYTQRVNGFAKNMKNIQVSKNDVQSTIKQRLVIASVQY